MGALCPTNRTSAESCACDAEGDDFFTEAKWSTGSTGALGPRLSISCSRVRRRAADRVRQGYEVRTVLRGGHGVGSNDGLVRDERRATDQSNMHSAQLGDLVAEAVGRPLASAVFQRRVDVATLVAREERDLEPGSAGARNMYIRPRSLPGDGPSRDREEARPKAHGHPSRSRCRCRHDRGLRGPRGNRRPSRQRANRARRGAATTSQTPPARRDGPEC